MPEILWRVLYARGCADEESARAFIHPTERDIIEPGALCGMNDAVSTIKKHISIGSRICVWGDYDVDGVSATAILIRTLRRLGANAVWHIPSRHEEGYGLNQKGVENLDCGLLITVDCGITDAAIINAAVKKGMSVVVTDHHTPPATLPDCPVVNPLLGDYPNRNLCGAGVAFKLAMALDTNARELIDIAALATVADVVSLTGENRAIVKIGLEAMNQKKRPGIRALMRAAGLDGEIYSHTVAFQLAPRLNATGRLDDAQKALKLLLSVDDAQADDLADELNALNQRRRAMEKLVIDECEEQ
ncbi:MAG: DHH family phosphoesterase, partial [Clostridia bacterium]|nr:DHH family phosphoesterase [Clostridia bacterium]